MAISIDSQLDETLRDALVAYTLNEVVPNDPQFVPGGLNRLIKTPNDLYEYLLLDVQVSQAVQCSPVASAIASVQQYINGALMGMEPGYETRIMEEHLITQWRDIQSQYPIWAADQQLRYYPENHIDPRLRLNKSMYFQQLENDLNQNRINLDTAQEAVRSYLARFEEVANLTITNGYINTTDFKNGMYYFIGRSQGENQYYWRSVDMSQRTHKDINDPNPDGPKVDYPQPGAWSDWHKANLPISASAIERTIRPVYFNHRLFVFWVELVDQSTEAVTIEQSNPPTDPKAPVTSVTTNPMLHLNMVYKKYDDSWSMPRTVIKAWSESALFKVPDVASLVESIVIQDGSKSPDSLFVAMYAGYEPGNPEDGSADKYAYLRTAVIDKNFNVNPIYPVSGHVPDVPLDNEDKEHVLKVTRLYAHKNKGRFQFRYPAYNISVKSVNTLSPNTQDGFWNHGDVQKDIASAAINVDVVYNRDSLNLEFTSKLSGTITSHRRTVLSFTGSVADEQRTYRLTLLTSEPPSSDGYYTLLEGSQLEAVAGRTFAVADNYLFILFTSSVEFIDGFIRKSQESWFFPVPALNAGQSFSITGALLHRGVIRAATAGQSALFDSFLSSGLNPNHHLFRPTLVSTAGAAQYLRQIKRPTAFDNPSPAGYGGMVALKNGDRQGIRTPPDPLQTLIPIDTQRLRPDWYENWPSQLKQFSVAHGVQVFRDGYWVGGAFRLTQIELEATIDSATPLIAPRINTRASPTLGTAEFIDFAGSGIDKTDGSTTVARQPIRMNTLFARELISRANLALEVLLAWDTQNLEEPPLDPPAEVNLMDFNGANGKYFWELFLHLPFLVSQRMNLEQQFDESERWLAFIFDPARKPDASGRPAYWNVRPLMDDPQLDAVSRAPSDPDGIAASHPVRYRKAIYLHYLKNLIDRGDAAYRQLTPDSLGEAKLWYVRVLDLLGPRPDVRAVDQWQPVTLLNLRNSTRSELREYEQKLIEQDQLRDDSAAENDGQSQYHFREPPLQLRTFTPDLTLTDLDSGYLRLPFNKTLVSTWDTVESRLRNLRNNRTLDGKALSVGLFAAPLDPKDLLAAFGQGAAAGGAGRLLAQEVPPYRFSVMHQRAAAAVETLIQFGQTLLSMIERNEQAQFQELQQQQAWEFARFAIELQAQAQVVELEQRNALLASKAVVQGRLAFYTQRVDEDVNAGEKAAAALHLTGRIAEGVSSVANVVGSGLKLPPNLAGGGGGGVAGGLPIPTFGAFAYGSAGGWRLEGVPQMVAETARGLAFLSYSSAQAIDRAELFRRRHQEWTLARDQAALDLAQLDVQLAVLDEQVAATAIALQQAEAAHAQARVEYEFLGKRFTNAQLYQWLNGQFATFYYQAYDATLALCLSAEACWQFEIADFTSRFIRTGGWNDSQRGLGAGEALRLQLLNLDAAYLKRHERQLEISKTVSFRRLKAMDPSINKAWEDLLADLFEHGHIDFELSASMFDDDYPGTSLRRLKRVGVTLALALGPFEEVSVILSQSYNAVEMGGTLKENLRPGQQIAVSHADNDDGQFSGEDDGRYQPFEGTGAISRWQLRFTEQDQALRRRQIESLTDIVVHLRYTARPL